MGGMASQITSPAIVYPTVYPSRRSKKTSNLRVTGLCVGNSPLTGEFLAQRASNAENVSIWWRNHSRVLQRRIIYPVPLPFAWYAYHLIVNDTHSGGPLDAQNTPVSNPQFTTLEQKLHIYVPVSCIVGYGRGYCGICKISLLECVQRKYVNTHCILHDAGLFTNSRTWH